MGLPPSQGQQPVTGYRMVPSVADVLGTVARGAPREVEDGVLVVFVEAVAEPS